MVEEAGGVSINSNSSGDSGWIFASVMIGVTNGERKRERGKETQCQRARLKADTVLFRRDKKRERERERKGRRRLDEVF